MGRNGGGLDRDCCSGGNEKWLDSLWVHVEGRGGRFRHGLGAGYERKELRMTLGFALSCGG